MSFSDQPVPKLRHHKATGQGAVVLDGQWHYLGKYGTAEAKEGYDRLIADWLAHGRQLPSPDEQLAVAELILAYWRYAERRYVTPNGKPRKELSALKQALRPVRQLCGSLLVRDFGPRALLTVRTEYVKAGYARKTVNDQIKRVRRMFKWATVNELILPSVYHGLKTIDGLRAGESKAREPRDVKPVPQPLIDAVLRRVGRQVGAMIRLQLLCGARPGELGIMRACDLDTTGRLWLYKPPRHKTMKFGKAREIYFGPQAQMIICEFLKPDTARYLFSPADAVREHREAQRNARKTPLWPSHERRLQRRRRRNPQRTPRTFYTTDAYRQAIWRACDAIDREMHRNQPSVAAETRLFPRWSPNQLRHNFGTRMRKEHGVEVARVLLGHSSISTTEIYSERDAALAASVIGKVG